MKYDCLIVDDEAEIARGICEYFNMFDINSAYVTGYGDGMTFLSENQVSLLLLDINLGHDSGFLFCKEVRKNSTVPIIFISARNREQDILSGLNLGGDDYITKPFSMNILLAKARAMIKRHRGGWEKEDAADVTFGKVRVERATMRLYREGMLVKLKPMEWKLLNYFLEHQDRVIAKEELLGNVWADMFVSEGTISSHVRHLREKIEDDPNNPVFIKTAWGTGYICELRAECGIGEG